MGAIFLGAYFKYVLFRGQFSRGLFFPGGFHMYVLFQKQPPRGVSIERYSANMQQNYKRAPMPKCDYSNVALQLY